MVTGTLSKGSTILMFSSALLAIFCNPKDDSAGHPLKAEATEGAQEDNALPRLHTVPEFSFTDEDGRPLGTKQLAGQPYLAAFMFTRCPSVCPRLTSRMKEVDVAAKKAKKSLRLLSISVDPEHDAPHVLAAYAKKHGADVPNWAFVTGDYEAIARTSEEGFKVGLSGSIEETKPHLGITHGSHLILVDGRGSIRGYFRSTDDESVTQILRALDRL